MERERVLASSQATYNLIKKLGVQLLDTSKSNAYWEDYWQAVKDDDVQWISENVNSQSVSVPNLSFIATTDLNGNVISQIGDIKEFTGKPSNPAIIHNLKNKNDFSGLMQTSKGLAVIAAAKITNDEGECCSDRNIDFLKNSQ